MVKSLEACRYRFDRGPVSKEELREGNFKEGNCRLAVQRYLYEEKGLFLTPRQILDLYTDEEIGKFVVEEGDFREQSISLLRKGDVLYAERIKNGKKSVEQMSREEWIKSLHSAMYIGGGEVLHATVVTGGICVWEFERFKNYYRPIAAKRVLPVSQR